MDAGKLHEGTEEQLKPIIFHVRREAMFYDAIVCWHGVQANNIAARDFVAKFIRPLECYGIPICVCSDNRFEFAGAVGHPFSRMSMPPFEGGRRIQVWEGFTAQEGIALDCVRYGIKYRLQPAEIELVVRQLAEDKANGIAITDTMVSSACIDVLPPASGSVKHINSGYVLEDLKLTPVQKQTILNICAHVWHSHQVFDDWGLDKKYPYGKGVTALFVGPPGTGKTMAVHTLANMLKIPLYRIELSQVVDKYIGETEKRLEEIFNLAEKSNTILFFDEADSIFGKRSEVNDSKDRYANTEVSYILQRIEQYDAIVILATNFKKNIDEAFMRRMRYLVEFQMPSVDIRREIWESCFAKDTPLNGVDFSYLARQFEFSGGNIKNIALNAAFLAAGAHENISMRHILECIRTENLKLGKSMLKNDFAEYGHLWQTLKIPQNL